MAGREYATAGASYAQHPLLQQHAVCFLSRNHSCPYSLLLDLEHFLGFCMHHFLLSVPNHLHSQQPCRGLTTLSFPYCDIDRQLCSLCQEEACTC